MAYIYGKKLLEQKDNGIIFPKSSSGNTHILEKVDVTSDKNNANSLIYYINSEDFYGFELEVNGLSNDSHIFPAKAVMEIDNNQTYVKGYIALTPDGGFEEFSSTDSAIVSLTAVFVKLPEDSAEL